MKDDGRAFILLAADKMGEGKLDGSRRVFDNILRSNYHVAAAAVLHGRFYTKMGTQFPVEMYAIGPRRKSRSHLRRQKRRHRTPSPSCGPMTNCRAGPSRQPLASQSFAPAARLRPQSRPRRSPDPRKRETGCASADPVG